MSSKLATLPVAELIEDLTIYPRHSVDSAHVQAMVFALQSGAMLPPVVADRKSKRITDGWHRARAYTRLHGPTATVSVELVDYASEREMILDAVARNAAHGRRLDAIDRTRSVVLLRAAGCTDAQISIALHVPEERVEKLAVKLASGSQTAAGTVPGTGTIPLKRCVLHLAGSRLTKGQAEVHHMLPGTSFLLVARQLRRGLEEDMVDLTDEKLVGELTALRGVLSEKLPGGKRK